MIFRNIITGYDWDITDPAQIKRIKKDGNFIRISEPAPEEPPVESPEPAPEEPPIESPEPVPEEPPVESPEPAPPEPPAKKTRGVKANDQGDTRTV